MTNGIWGQYMGSLDGTNKALVFLNIDKDRPNYGTVSVFDLDPALLSFNANISIRVDGDAFEADVDKLTPFYINGNTPDEEAYLPTSAKLSGLINGFDVEGEWFSDGETNGRFRLTSQEGFGASEPDHVMSWDDFKTWAFEQKKKNENLIFRGQEDSSYKLSTLFHRRDRRDLNRFDTEDLPTLNIYLSSVINRTFNMKDPAEYSELIFLGQHHGYPTPFLDWSESPFVASFFAFKDVKTSSDSNKFVRIFIFDYELWKKIGPGNVNNINDPRAAFCPYRLQARDNPRSLPQQSIVTFSNVLAIEAFVKYHELKKNTKVLTIVDVPASDRHKAIKDLQIMGLTAASLFPGLDGTCQALKEKFF